MAIPTFYTLHNGFKIPSIGFGTFHTGERTEIKQAVKKAIAVGYRHFDGAAMYGNEDLIGEAFQEVFKVGVVKREDLFITSKLPPDHHGKEHVRPSLLQTLKDLQLDYLDLYLIHWPFAAKYTGPKTNFNTSELSYVPISDTWAEMEKLVEEGKIRSIGISNFNVQSTLDLLCHAKIKPQVNQIEVHPLLTQERLIAFSKQHRILITAFFPLGGHRPDDAKSVIENDLIKKLAAKHKKTPAQVLLRWSLQLGLNPIVKSIREERMSENINVFDFELTGEEVKEISALNRNERLNGTVQIPHFPPVFD